MATKPGQRPSRTQQRSVQRSLSHGRVRGSNVVAKTRTGTRVIRTQTARGSAPLVVRIQRAYGPLPKVIAGEEVRMRRAMATVMQAELRRSTIWPRDTGLSRRLFVVTEVGRSGWRVSNRARAPGGFPYPAFVNNARKVGRKRNRNYQAVQRWLRLRWPSMVRQLEKKLG